MKRTVVLLRHAKSDWAGDEDDAARPLAPRGRREAPEVGRWLAAHDAEFGRPDLAVVSPAVRARSTWELVAAELPDPPPTSVVEAVYAASGATLLGVVRGLPDDVRTAVLVGHNPGLEELVTHLTGRQLPMPTSSLAVIELPAGWLTAGDGAGVLVAGGRPPVLLRGSSS